MRRVSATLFVALLSLSSIGSLITPALSAADTESSPACCRRNGKHHCVEPPTDASWKAVPACGNALQRLSQVAPAAPLSASGIRVANELPQATGVIAAA